MEIRGGIYDLWAEDAPDGEYEVYVRAKDAANNQATAGPITMNIDRVPQSDTAAPVITVPEDIVVEDTVRMVPLR
jgi:hypothetical protein